MVKYNIVELTDMDLPRLQTIATDLGLTDIKGVEKQALIYQILDRQAESVAGMQKEKEAQKSEQKRRGPGRPPKNKSAESAAEASASEKEPKADTAEKAESKPAKRRPGRPKKNKAAEPTEAAAPAKAAFLTPKHRPRGTSMTAQQPFRQSADPLSENSRISWNYREWVCGLAQALTGNHYVNAHIPAQPASNNQPTTVTLVSKWCYTT